MEGLEPSRGCPRQLLKLVRLPFRHIRVAVHRSKERVPGWVSIPRQFQIRFVLMYHDAMSSKRSAGVKMVVGSMPMTFLPTT